jgi:RNA polymerase sigma-70 factor (ECF subfamily)
MTIHVTAPADLLLDSAPGPQVEETPALLSRARSGDRSAANEVFTRYEERIRRIVRVRLGPSLRRWADSGDLVQETCRSALADLDRVPLGSGLDFLDWLARIATNRIRDLADQKNAMKRELGRERPIAAGSGGAHLPPDPRSSPSEHAFRAELREILDEAVGALPDNYREVIVLRDYQGVDWPEIARVLSTPSLHAAQQLHQRAWIKVRILARPRLAQLGR